MRDWGRLLRLALLPSAVADVAAGVVLGAGSWPAGAGPFLLVAASLFVYHGAMALNDWADRDWDLRVRPDRPIPSGTIPASRALLVAATLLVLAVPLAIGAPLVGQEEPAPLAILVPTATLLAGLFAVAYDLGPRGPRLGPVLLALCRGLNLGSGVLLGYVLAPQGVAGEPVLGILAVVLYAAYVFVVSCLGRLEDGEDDGPLGRLPSRYLGWLGALLVAVGSLPTLRSAFLDGALPEPRSLLPLALGAAGATGLFRLARRAEWSRPEVMAAMGAALRRLLVFTATAALLVEGTSAIVVAGAVLLGYPLSFALRRVFPPS